MTRIRRALAVTGLAVAVTLGGAVPALAAWSNSDTVGTTISTGTVAPPTGVTAERAGCYFYNLILEARVTWAPSPTTRVSGYTITAYRNDTVVNEKTVGPSTRSTTITAVAGTTYTVTTNTEYGWTAESARTGTVWC
ncbi:hypothetical protein [Blastococcus sp. SYSU DS0619]